jgi:glutathione synthase/RimK-type ligase-like ATP-grasp enzyme
VSRGREPRLRVDGAPLEDLDALLLRELEAPLPRVRRDPDRPRLYPRWYAHLMEALARSAATRGLVAALHASGRPVVNPPRPGSPDILKVHQLERLRAARLPIPRTLVTSDPREAAAFLEAVPDAIVKPVDGAAWCARADEERRRRLAAIRFCPAVFQERIEGEDVRVMVVGDEVVSAVRVVAAEAEGAADYRGTERYRRGDCYEEVALDRALERACVRAAAACGLEFSAIDLRRSPRRGAFFLECNSSPWYGPVEHALGHPISAKLARHLVRRAGEARRRGEGGARGRLPEAEPAPAPEPVPDLRARYETRASFFAYEPPV